jgi:membrane-bound lytic murein transglycosylase B
MLIFDRKFARILCMFIGLAALGLWLPAQAGATAKNHNDQFQALQKKLIKDGFNPDKIARLYSRPEVFFEADGVTILFTYSEAKVDYDQFANDWSIGKAKKYMAEHRQDLDRVEKRYGVDSRVITAILLVESGLGKPSTSRSRQKNGPPKINLKNPPNADQTGPITS